MRSLAACGLLALAGLPSLPAHARPDVVKFEGVQERCVRTANIRFGPGERWSSCRVMKGRWFVTMGIMDFYQAQYCLGQDDGTCEQRAILVFANRAYTPDAEVAVARMDAGSTQYDDPLVVETPYGDLMTISGRTPDGAQAKTYYLWRSRRWVPIDGTAWLRDVAKRLPKGVSLAAGGSLWPDVDTMSVKAALRGVREKNGGVAEIELAVKKDRFVVKKVSVAKS